jgi:hypothetical protein
MYCIAADRRPTRRRPWCTPSRRFFELAHDVGDGRVLLADRDVDALNAGALLVDDRVDRQRGLAGLAVADDQLALAAADRDHRVDRLVAGLHRLVDRLAPDHARGDAFRPAR